MGFIIWYKLEFPKAGPAGPLPLRVSNDVFSGEYNLDADINLTMTAGATADTFDIKIYNLPADLAKKLKGLHQEGAAKRQPLLVKVYLGYFEDLPQFTATTPVMIGAVMRLTNTVDEKGMYITRVEGQEIAGYKIRTVCAIKDAAGDATAKEFAQAVVDLANGKKPAGAGGLVGAVSALLGADTPPITLQSDGPQISKKLTNFTLRGGNGLDALGQIARQAATALVIHDNKVLLGTAVGADSAPVAFDPDTNIVIKEDAQENDETLDPCEQQKTRQTKTEARGKFDMTVLGHGGLRVGQKATLKTEDAPKDALRINYLEHIFSSKAGYTCRLTLIVAPAGTAVQRSSGASQIFNRVRDVAERSVDQRTPIDVGEVTEYFAGSDQKHLVTLNYGQTPSGDSLAPSVDTTVDKDGPLHNKPVSSPFAFGKCGLIVPIYPKMRAVLAHNRGLTNDAVVSGVLWSENPRLEPPPNKPGDYWLSLPTQLGPDGLPSGKGVHDLTDKDGRRVVQARGLHIMVGDGLLTPLGNRPSPEGIDDKIVIEHKSGTTITIDAAGKVTIQTSGQEISMTNGSVTLKLNGPAVEVS